MRWITYDKFKEKELNRELWEIDSRFPKENYKVELKEEKLIMEATSAKDFLGIKVGENYLKKLDVWEPSYVGEALRIVAKRRDVKGVEVTFIPYLNESFGEGNVHLRGVSKRFCYLIGINYKYDERNVLQNSDVFVHLWDKEEDGYLAVGGRIHYKDIIPELSEITLGLEWSNDFKYRIGNYVIPYYSPVQALDLSVKEDASSISRQGLEFWDIKIDIFGKRPSRIKAAVSDVKIKPI